MTDRRGPGETVWIANEDGSISCRLHNDPIWETTFARNYDLDTGRGVIGLLEKAYLMGRKDQAEIIRRALDFGKDRR